MRYHFCKKCNALYVRGRDNRCDRCGNVHHEISEKRSPFWKPLTISVFRTYTTKDFDGEERTVTSSRNEELLCERFGVIRHEEFQNTYGKDHKYEDKNNPIDSDGITVEAKEEKDIA